METLKKLTLTKFTEKKPFDGTNVTIFACFKLIMAFFSLQIQGCCHNNGLNTALCIVGFPVLMNILLPPFCCFFFVIVVVN